MNLYPQRIADLHDHLADKWQQRDKQATEILLASLLPASVTRLMQPWLIIETDYPNRDTDAGWFSFGGLVPAKSMAEPRLQRREPCEKILAAWMEDKKRGKPGVFIESEWRRSYNYTRIGRQSANLTLHYRVLTYSSIRLRVDHPRGDSALRMNRDQDRQELARLTQRVLDSALRPARTPFAERISAPPSFLYWCELLQRLSPHLADWENLTGSLAAIAYGIATLYNDGRDPDWQAVERLIRDMIPYQTGYIMRQADKPPKAEGESAWSLFRASGMVADEPFTVEVARLVREGVLARRRQTKRVKAASGRGGYHPGKYAIADSAWAQLIDREKRLF